MKRVITINTCSDCPLCDIESGQAICDSLAVAMKLPLSERSMPFTKALNAVAEFCPLQTLSDWIDDIFHEAMDQASATEKELLKQARHILKKCLAERRTNGKELG